MSVREPSAKHQAGAVASESQSRVVRAANHFAERAPFGVIRIRVPIRVDSLPARQVDNGLYPEIEVLQSAQKTGAALLV